MKKLDKAVLATGLLVLVFSFPSFSALPLPAQANSEQTPTPSSSEIVTVWVNTDTRVYHRPGSRWYGKTRKGKYMLEPDAIKAGYQLAKPDHDKPQNPPQGATS